MTEFSSVTVLYTANIRGDLSLLPRLFTLIQEHRQAQDSPVFLLDVGDTCTPDAWVCRATQGRAPFLVLDSMGYDAAVIGGREQIPIPPPALRQLVGDMIMPVIIWDRAKSLTKRGVTLFVAPGSAEPTGLEPVIRIDRTTDALPQPGDPSPVLGDVPHAHLARVDMHWPAWAVKTASIWALPPQTPIDPTIAAVVELVEAEARHIMQGQEGNR